MKEYELLTKYHYPEGAIEGPFDVMSQALYTKSTNLLNLDECRARTNEIFDYLELKKRYDSLVEESKGKLQFTKEYFDLLKHQFQTLDEVEKALKNKAFL